MEIVIAAGGMPFGPTTATVKSLGGSEQAAMCVAQELKKRGHIVTLFTMLPPPGAPDHFANGGVDEVGVRWCDLAGYASFVENTEHDLLIVSRDPRMTSLPAQAKKKVLWCHDIATHRGMQMAFDNMQWSIDEVWCVSEWHRQQIHKVTGYPLEYIVALRNGIVPVDVIPNDIGRMPKTLLFAARPERGLDNLIRPGGIMERLPDHTLYVAMYEHFPEHMRDYYQMIFARMKEMPNVKYLGGLSQPALRDYMQNVEAYVYPTQFEETSCILAREAIERRTPFLTTREGALPETLGECGIFFEDWRRDFEPEKHAPAAGSDEWCEMFARFVQATLTHEGAGSGRLIDALYNMQGRTDLYWDGVAEMMEQNAQPKSVSVFSRAWSLIQDGDVIPARALISEIMEGMLTGDVTMDEGRYAHLNRLLYEIEAFYPFLLPPSRPDYESLADYYARFYAMKKPELSFDPERGKDSGRYNIFARWLADLPAGSLVAEYGCGEGHLIGFLAKRFPDLRFVGFDHVAQNVKMVRDGAIAHGIYNLKVGSALSPTDTYRILDELYGQRADAVICSEVLEHNAEPWTLATEVERMCVKGGKMIVSVPYGPWEPLSWTKSAAEFPWRNHIWNIDKQTLREMFNGKQEAQLLVAADGMDHSARALGQNCITFQADHTPIPAIDPLEKALRHRSRQTCAAAIIAYNNENTILHMLHSIKGSVQFVQIAHGPSTDHTLTIIQRFFADHPHIGHNVIDVGKITPATLDPDTKKWTDDGYGFDDARNASIAGLDAFDWILWIDTDEYLVGDFRKYLRGNCLDSYMICQHHFTTEPAGGPAQVDRPARLIRTTSKFRAQGKIHEHFEMPTGGPGRAHMPMDVHIGHTGYQNENVRRGRFERNFPFLVWDHHVNPDRKLHKYLWFRDIVHRMRYFHLANNRQASRALAEEAIRYYNENVEILAGFGAGSFQSITYRNEALQYLGRGVPLQMTVQLDDRQAPIAGVFESYEEAERMLGAMLKPEFERRRSKYY